MAAAPTSSRVYLIDDDDIILELMTDLVASIGAEASGFRSATDFLDQYSPCPCECVVSDVRMPGVSGLHLQRELQSRFEVPPPLILVTGYAEVSAAVEGMKQGAFDFVEKPLDGHRFLEKVQAALNLSCDLHQARLQQSARAARLALLTPKEREVLDEVLKGLSSKEIAQHLGLSVRTVENHRARLMDKLRVKSALELVRDFLPRGPH
ncbi:MAG TPA: response regulator [Dongiaceae bacterium]|nr:response regulator [Dongiaceae bacterium]